MDCHRKGLRSPQLDCATKKCKGHRAILPTLETELDSLQKEYEEITNGSFIDVSLHLAMTMIHVAYAFVLYTFYLL